VLERGGAGLNLTWEVREGILHHPWSMPPPSTLEGQAVRVANRIAVVTSDLEAALDGGLISPDELPAEPRAALGPTPGEWVARFIGDAVSASLDSPQVGLSPRMEAVHATLQGFLAARVHARSSARARSDRAIHCLQSVVVYQLEHPEGLPPAVRVGDPLEVRVLDEVAGMTDGRVLQEFSRFFLPVGGATD
jgi:dGTPase